MNLRNKISIILPTLNEEENVKKFLKKLKIISNMKIMILFLLMMDQQIVLKNR